MKAIRIEGEVDRRLAATGTTASPSPTAGLAGQLRNAAPLRSHP
ncbi:hypothetical protein AVDCRST_MAG81-4719 [uncultured Synechococcales cyanobacterium]|uniref:Uncharacterized protein n=1 Tax=uncultured Synechococcales cyanobacterium TaxID=1936017 RepID=A0A6J4VXG8_9CYAN|nr:hypothetical protein AVDCRST_MAG81-4719 [uncultured Synechococcales cyanobacterium]